MDQGRKKPGGMGDDMYEAIPISAIPEVSREHWQAEPVQSELLERPIRAELVHPTPRDSHMVQQAYLSDVVTAELVDIPSDHGDIPLASLVDDLHRKKQLRKVMGKPDKKFGPPGHEGEADGDNDTAIPAGVPTLPKELVNYRYSGQKGRMCQDCIMFDSPAGCSLVIGMIRPVDTCDKFEAKPTTHTIMGGTPIQASLVNRTAEAFREGEREFFTKIQAKMEDEGFRCASEVSPPGWEGTVLRMKKHPEIDNPWALAHYMKNQGYAPHAGPRGGKKKESEDEAGTPEGAKKGWEKRKGKGVDRGYLGSPTATTRADADRYLKNQPAAHGRVIAFQRSQGKFAPDTHDDEDATGAMFTRRENPRQRRARIKRKPVDPDTAAAIRRALMSEGVRESVMVYRSTARLVETDYEGEAGTPDGAKKGWATRKGGGGKASVKMHPDGPIYRSEKDLPKDAIMIRQVIDKTGKIVGVQDISKGGLGGAISKSPMLRPMKKRTSESNSHPIVQAELIQA